MNKKERISSFRLFYNNTYKDTLHFFLEKSGDFLNAEDFLADVYKKVYAYFLKAKQEDNGKADACLKKSIKQQLMRYDKKYNKKQPMPLIQEESISLTQLTQKEWEIDEEMIEKKMLRQEILSFVSQKPMVIRRVFANRVYLHKGAEETARVMKIPPKMVESYLLDLLIEMEDQFLIDFE